MSPCFECRCCCQPHRPTVSPLMIYFLTLLRTSDVLFRPFPWLLSAGCSYKHCQTGAVPMIYYNVRRNGSEENTQNWQHYPLSRNTISTCILATARCILYKPTKLMVSLTSLAPPHLSYLPQVGKEKCPKLWRVILIRNISPNLASH